MSDSCLNDPAISEKPSAAPTQSDLPHRLAHATLSIAVVTILSIAWMVYTERQERVQEAHGLRAAPFVVDLNLANENELHLLPGVGPKLAQQILRLRDERGGFERIEDLLDVPGIKKTRLEQIRPFVMLSAADQPRSGPR